MATVKSNKTIINTGKFTSDGKPKILKIRSDVDSVQVWNEKQAGLTPTPGVGVEFKWQRGMTDDTGIEKKKADGVNTLEMHLLTTGGFSLVDTGAEAVGGARAVTSTSNATKPVVAAANTTGVHVGSIIRLQAITSAYSISGIDLEVGAVTASTNFTTAYAFPLARAAGTTGTYRLIKYENSNEPQVRYILGITAANPAVITMSVTHGYSVGQRIKIVVPAEYKMTEINDLYANVTAVNTTTNTVTVDIDASGFTTFVFPLDAALPFSPAITVPLGNENKIAYVDRTPYTFNDEGYLGIVLDGGADSPGGVSGDTMYWEAKTSFFDTDET